MNIIYTDSEIKKIVSNILCKEGAPVYSYEMNVKVTATGRQIEVPLSKRYSNKKMSSLWKACHEEFEKPEYTETVSVMLICKW